MSIHRRDVLIGSAALAATPLRATAAPRPRVWTLDTLRRWGVPAVRVSGAPRVVDSPYGRSLAFDGVRDGLFLDEHPLAGAATFNVEALFRPDGGAREQRWLHLETVDQPDLAPGAGITRLLFEIRVVEDRWYLDAFVGGAGYRATLASPDKTFAIGRWYHVAQSFDGRYYRSFVDGVLQAESETAFTPQGRGRASIGVRLNGINPFHGAIRDIRFTPGSIELAR